MAHSGNQGSSSGRKPPIGRRFQPGQSGNPKGRPSLKPIRELAQRYDEVAIKTLVDVAKNGDRDAARVAAAVALLDRGHGKPEQQIDMAVTQVPPQIAAMSDAELAAAIDAERERQKAAQVKPS